MAHRFLAWSGCSLVLAFWTGCGSSSSEGGPIQCHTMTGSGSNQVCAYSINGIANFSCSPNGQTSGACPGGIVGCCQHGVTIADPDPDGNGGGSVQSGQCFYDSASAATGKSNCKSPFVWSKTEPTEP
jgi:hypothetical protein